MLLGLSALRNAHLWFGYAAARRRAVDNAEHARDALEWLKIAASRSNNQGVSHSLHFARGWLPGYPETTGYIIPTLMLLARRYGWEDADDLAASAWGWLCGIQQQDGSFHDLAGRPQVFDTGQILIGANYLCRTGNEHAGEVGERAARWLMGLQADDGSFVSHSYNQRPHAYYSRVGAALLETGILLDCSDLREAGLANLEWTLRQQRADGWFAHMSFADHPPFSHTIVYTLEGLLAGFRLTHDTRMRDAVVLCASVLRERIVAHGGLIRSQYREDFQAVDEEICVTGLCQWAALCFRLARLGGGEFLGEAERSLEAAKYLQLRSPLAALHGALPGSSPLSGRYMRYALPNWGVKFFLDVLLEAKGGDDLPALI